MAKNINLFFDEDGSPRARGPASEKLLMAFLETDIQGSDYICNELINDITAIEDESAESREFNGNAHSVTISAEGVTIECTVIDSEDAGDGAEATAAMTVDNTASSNAQSTSTDNPLIYTTGLKHFREVLEDWEAFILDDQTMT